MACFWMKSFFNASNQIQKGVEGMVFFPAKKVENVKMKCQKAKIFPKKGPRKTFLIFFQALF